MTAITQSEFILSQPKPLDQNAAAVYIASLPADSGKRTQAQALRVIAKVLGTDLERVNWGTLRSQPQSRYVPGSHKATSQQPQTRYYLPSGKHLSRRGCSDR